MAMWKRPRTWATLALLIWLNFVAWSVRTSLKQSIGAIPLYQHKVDDGIEYTTLAPSYFFFDSIWFSYIAALLIGLALPVILVRFLHLLWHRRQRMGRIAAGLVLLVICNVLAWDVMTFLDAMPIGIPLYKTINSYNNIEYTGIVPGIKMFSWAASYALSFLISLGVPLFALWLWRRNQRQPEATGTRNVPAGVRALALLPIFVAFNMLAWDWAQSSEKGELFLVLEEGLARANVGLQYYDVKSYSGIAPGIRFQNKATSVLVCLFVGEILPFLLVIALFRRWKPPALPLPPVAGAPR